MSDTAYGIAACIEILQEGKDSSQRGFANMSNTAADAIIDHLLNYRKVLSAATPPAPSVWHLPAAIVNAAKLDPVEGDQLPKVGSTVLIHLGREDKWVEHTVVGYYVWGDLNKDKHLHRVFVRVIDSKGIPNARMLCDIRYPGKCVECGRGCNVPVCTLCAAVGDPRNFGVSVDEAARNLQQASQIMSGTRKEIEELPYTEVPRETCEGLEHSVFTFDTNEHMKAFVNEHIAPRFTAADFLDKAKAIQTERATEYDKPGGERNMAKIVTAFNAITGQRLTETEGWAFMAVLKQVRLFSNRKAAHQDSCVDFVSYAALQAESAVKNGV